MKSHINTTLFSLLMIAGLPRPAAEQDRSPIVSIQIRDGAELKTLGIFGTDVRIVLAGVGPRVKAGEEYKEYPYRDMDVSLGWQVSKTGKGYTIRVTNQTKRPGWYLSYDPAAPERGVFLAAGPAAGSYWDIDRFPAMGEDEATPIRASSIGRDWLLDYDQSPERYRRGDPVAYVQTLYKPNLTKGRGARFLIDFYGK
jgi:hypothetical protein